MERRVASRGVGGRAREGGVVVVLLEESGLGGRGGRASNQG